MKHTKLPWHVGMKPGPMIYGTKGEQIADMMEANGEVDLFPYVGENQANAAFIVRACNAHDELVAALGFCIAMLDIAFMAEGDAFGVHHNDADDCVSGARAALAKAKGE